MGWNILLSPISIKKYGGFSNVADRGCEFRFFRGIHIRNWCWYLHVHKTYEHQYWTPGTSRAVDFPWEQHVITLRSRDFIKKKVKLPLNKGHVTKVWEKGR